MILAYGVAINQALSDPKSKLEDLLLLREHAHAILQAQGDLKGATRQLEQEIKRRQKESGGKGGGKGGGRGGTGRKGSGKGR